MEMWALFIQLNCAEPRVKFLPFYEKVMGTKYPAPSGVQMPMAYSMVFEGFAYYADYIAAYAENCRFSQERK